MNKILMSAVSLSLIAIGSSAYGAKPADSDDNMKIAFSGQQRGDWHKKGDEKKERKDKDNDKCKKPNPHKHHHHRTSPHCP